MSAGSIPQSFDEVVGILIDAKLRGLHTSDVGVIRSYDRVTQSCSVLPVVARMRRQENGEVGPSYMPEIGKVPVVFPGGGENSETWDLVAGDSVLIVYLSRSADTWKARGGTQVNPEDGRRHDLNDAVVIPSVRAFAEAIGAEGVSEDGMVKRWRGQLFLGSALAADPVVRVSDLGKIIAALTTAIAALALVSDPSASALQALKDALTTPLLNFPSGSPRVKLE